MTPQTLNQEQVNETLRKWETRTEARPTSEEYAVFAPLRDEWERLNAIPEASRTPWQVEAHAELFDRLITDYWSPWWQWSKQNQSSATFNAAFQHHVKQYQN
jgi:hypothetical protein